MNTPTPRTDAEAGTLIDADEVVPADFARTLERELATERARRDDLVADIKDVCITLESAIADCDDYALQNTEFKLTAVRDVLLPYIPNAASDMREECATLERELGALTAERDQLRAENSNLRAGQKACEACDEPTAFEVRKLRERAERAEAELAAERARLDSGQILLIVAGERVWHCGVDLRAAIDAAMKEDAK